MDYHSEFIKATKELGIGGSVVGSKPIWGRGELKGQDWQAIYWAYMGFQHQVKLIVSSARARSQAELSNEK